MSGADQANASSREVKDLIRLCERVFRMFQLDRLGCVGFNARIYYPYYFG